MSRIVGLDGASPFIHSINRAHSLVGRLGIDAASARAYTEFFCAHVHGGDGSFSILEHQDDVDWTGFYHQQKDELGCRLFPMRLWPEYTPTGSENVTVEQGDFVIEATLTHGGGLFRAIFLVKPSGMMAMLYDNPLIGDLDVRFYGWTQKNNWLLSTFPEVS